VQARIIKVIKAEHSQLFPQKQLMSNPNDSLNQKLCHYLNHGHTFGLLWS